jgi:Ca2+-transporting ATPase
MKMGLYGIRDQYVRLSEKPFSSDQKWMAVQCRPRMRDMAGSPKPEGEIYFMKGALERVLRQCTYVYMPGSDKNGHLLDQQVKSVIMSKGKEYALSGLRVIAMATGRGLTDMIFVGLAAIRDPPRPGVDSAVQQLLESGISVKMLTGDSQITAMAVGMTLGLYEEGHPTLSGEQIDVMDAYQLQLAIPQICYIGLCLLSCKSQT